MNNKTGSAREEKKKLLLITQAPFPYGKAMSSRIRSFCKLFNSMGINVHVIALWSTQEKFKPGIAYETEYCSFEVVSDKPISSLQTFIGNRNFVATIRAYIKSNNVDIIFSDLCQCYFTRILRIANDYSIPSFIEQCDKSNLSS